MVLAGGTKGVGKGPSSPGGEQETAPQDTNFSADASVENDEPASLQRSDNPPTTVKEETAAIEGEGAGVKDQLESTAPPASESVAADPDGADAAKAEEPEIKDEGKAGQETTEATREKEGIGASPDADEKALDIAPQGVPGADEQPDTGGNGGAGNGGKGEARGDASPPDETASAKTGHGVAVVPDDTTGVPEGDGMDVAGEEPALVQGDRSSVVGRVDSSDEEEEDDGFRVVVGREVAPAATPAVPTKRFLRGTNTLVNTPTTTSTGAAGAKESATGSKPVSAAAGIASLVPSKGAPVATTRPSLKPGEYPPTAELQQSTGRTAFDVDIDGMEEQPWRHPGVDIADFFNYGFTEDSWRVYCEKQLRNRYDRTRGRSKGAPITGNRGSSTTNTNTNTNTNSNNNSSNSNSLMRHGGGDRPGRMENSLQPHRPPPAQMHNNSGSGPLRPNTFGPQGPLGSVGAWGGGGGGGGGGSGPERFPHGFGSGPPPGHGSASPPWFDGQPQQQQQPQQMHQMRPQNRQHQQQFAPGPGGGMMRPGGANGNALNGGISSGRVNNPAGLPRSRSPDPRDGPPDNKMARLR